MDSDVSSESVAGDRSIGGQPEEATVQPDRLKHAAAATALGCGGIATVVWIMFLCRAAIEVLPLKSLHNMFPSALDATAATPTLSRTGYRQPSRLKQKPPDLNSALGNSAGVSVTGNNNTAAGVLAGVTVNGSSNAAFGDNAGRNVTGSRNIAIGRKAGLNIIARDTIAVGTGARATKNSAVAIGSRSIGDVANTISVGRKGAERRIMNVAAGVKNTDAVNLKQVRNSFNCC